MYIQRAPDERHTATLSSRMIPSKSHWEDSLSASNLRLGRSSARLLPQHWKVPQTLTSSKGASFTSPSLSMYPDGRGHKSDLLVCSNQPHPTLGKVSSEPGYRKIYFVLGSLEEWWSGAGE